MADFHFSNNIARGYVPWNCAYKDDSQFSRLQEDVIKETNPLREGMIFPDLISLAKEKFTKTQSQVVAKYGSLPPNIIIFDNGPMLFHITISKIRSSNVETPEIIKRKSVRFTASSISIGRLGENGTVTQILDEFRLKRP